MPVDGAVGLTATTAGRVECVPNFSEGREGGIVAGIAAAATGAGAWLLDTHSDPDHNRSVLTLAGSPADVLAAACESAAAAVRAIDLRRHEGVHPRFGAVDVVPFVPLGDAPMATCVELAHEAGRRIAAANDVPVFLYGEAAGPGRPRNLRDYRDGGFEALLQRGLPHPPDFGPPRLNPSAGAVAVGARGPLIAFNLVLDSPDLASARRVARGIRESSGGLPAVQAMAMALPSRRLAQVSMNLLDHRRTGILRVVNLARDLAAQAGCRLLEAELVGLAPAPALDGLEELAWLPGIPGPDRSVEARLPQ